MAVDEESPLLQSSGTEIDNQQRLKAQHARNRLVVYGSFIGIFLAAIDESLVLSTWSSIASQFHRLSEGSWLLVAYNFGYCVSLPVYGTLCDMYGRKNVLLGAYALFAVSCLACGVSTTLVQLVLARVIAGISGGGMISLVSIIITDLMPQDEVALLRSYANVVNVVGRSGGAPLGGLLISTIGWRWSFIGQLPFVIICLMGASYGLPSSLNDGQKDNDKVNVPRRTFATFDFSGLFSLATALVFLLCILQNLSVATEDQSVPLYWLVAGFGVAVIVFLLIEAYWSPKPLIPLHLFRTSLGGYCIIQALLLSGRWGFNSNLVPYFIRVENASDILAGSTLIFTAVGVSIGGLVAGAIIKRTKRYKTMTIIAVYINTLVYLLLFLRWRTGCALWEVIYLIPGGMSAGILFSTQFIGMSLGAPKAQLATCITTYYLCQQLGNIIGPAGGVAVVQRVFWDRLERELRGWNEEKFIGHILNDARFALSLPDSVQRIVRESYLQGFQFAPLIATGLSLAMLPVVMWLKEEEI